MENHGNRSADIAKQSGHGRPAREAPEKRKTSENSNVFHNLTSWEVRPPGRAPADGVREGIRKGYGCAWGAARPSRPKRKAHGRREVGNLQERKENRFADRKGLGGDVFHSNVSDAASRLSNGGEGNIENHGNRFADMDRREGGGWSGTDAVVCRAGWIEWIVDSFDAIGLI